MRGVPLPMLAKDNITAAERDGCRSHGLFRLPGYCLALERGKVRLISKAEISN